MVMYLIYHNALKLLNHLFDQSIVYLSRIIEFSSCLVTLWFTIDKEM